MSDDMVARLRAGKLARKGLMTDARITRAAEVLAEIDALEIETVRVLFPDQHGLLRGKTVTARVLPSVFENGLSVPSTLLLKDTANRTAFDIWTGDLTLDGAPLAGSADVTLVPDPDALTPLPYARHSAALICDLAFSDATPLRVAPRHVLRRATEVL